MEPTTSMRKTWNTLTNPQTSGSVKPLWPMKMLEWLVKVDSLYTSPCTCTYACIFACTYACIIVYVYMYEKNNRIITIIRHVRHDSQFFQTKPTQCEPVPLAQFWLCWTRTSPTFETHHLINVDPLFSAESGWVWVNYNSNNSPIQIKIIKYN